MHLLATSQRVSNCNDTTTPNFFQPKALETFYPNHAKQGFWTCRENTPHVLLNEKGNSDIHGWLKLFGNFMNIASDLGRHRKSLLLLVVLLQNRSILHLRWFERNIAKYNLGNCFVSCHCKLLQSQCHTPQYPNSSERSISERKRRKMIRSRFWTNEKTFLCFKIVSMKLELFQEKSPLLKPRRKIETILS